MNSWIASKYLSVPSYYYLVQNWICLGYCKPLSLLNSFSPLLCPIVPIKKKQNQSSPWHFSSWKPLVFYYPVGQKFNFLANHIEERVRFLTRKPMCDFFGPDLAGFGEGAWCLGSTLQRRTQDPGLATLLCSLCPYPRCLHLGLSLLGKLKDYLPDCHLIFSNFLLLRFVCTAGIFCLRLPLQGDNPYSCAYPPDPRVLVTQSCLTLCDFMDCSPPGSSVCGIFQARILEGGWEETRVPQCSSQNCLQ